jgi:phosphoesterase RecJ-like protein
VLDHHADTDNDIHYASVVLNRHDVSSTGELIYHLSQILEWPLDATSSEFLMTAIMGDTQGLTNDLASPATYRVIADIIEMGVSRTVLEDKRREASKMDPRIFRYKAELINRTELLLDGRLALVTIPQPEINTYSPLYNPAPLIQSDMLQTSGVLVAIVMKYYDDGKILASIRSNYLAPIANELAGHFGGGGHAHAAGFKVLGGRPINEVKSECCSFTQTLLTNLQTKETTHETIQHTDSSH